jgi:hypothetical protein
MNHLPSSKISSPTMMLRQLPNTVAGGQSCEEGYAIADVQFDQPAPTVQCSFLL